MASARTRAGHSVDLTNLLLPAFVMVFFRSFLLAGRRARFVLLRRPRIILPRWIRLSRVTCRFTVVLGTRSRRRRSTIRASTIRARAGRIRFGEWPESLV